MPRRSPEDTAPPTPLTAAADAGDGTAHRAAEPPPPAPLRPFADATHRAAGAAAEGFTDSFAGATDRAADAAEQVRLTGASGKGQGPSGPPRW